MAKYTLYRRDDLSGNVVADDTKFIVGEDGVKRNELDHFTTQAGYTQDKDLAEEQAKASQNVNQNTAEAGNDPLKEGAVITRDQVFNVLPWLKKFGGADADTLVDAYVKGFIESDGQVTQALAEMRFGTGSESYGRVFVNIVDPETGALKMTETEYLAGLEDFNTILTQNNLAGYAASMGKEKYATLVSLDVAMPEFAKRVKQIKGVIDMVDEELKATTIATYNDYYASQGVAAGVDESGLLALAFDPNLNSDILAGRVNSAELGALYEGVTEQKLGLGTVQKLLGAGIKVGQAEKQFEVAAQSARLLSSAARRQRRATTLSAENVLEASVFGDQETLSTITAIQNQIAAASSAALGAVRTQSGQVTGLTEAT
tara:strand:+ start:2810 stop:3928 length:1119 start_codon:yes stop_codon:yes gene_type:complete